MFANAIDMAARFTYPFVGFKATEDGEVASMVASFVVINSDGWAVTSAHVLDALIAVTNSVQPLGDGSPGEGSTPTAEALGMVTPTSATVAHTGLWSIPGFEASAPQLRAISVNRAADLAVGRLEPFSAECITGYPVLRDSESDPIRQGESVCRLGFPFHDVAAVYDTTAGSFRVSPGTFPVPRFAADSVVSRFNRHIAPDGGESMFIQTATPGLKGQSGGPLLDTRGRVCGIQSHTLNLDLGFDASYTAADGSQVTERQFLNVGVASLVDELRAMLDGRGITYSRG